MYRDKPNYQNKPNYYEPRRNACYNCGDPSHYKRDCPKLAQYNSQAMGNDNIHVHEQARQGQMVINKQASGLNYNGLIQAARGQSNNVKATK